MGGSDPCRKIGRCGDKSLVWRDGHHVFTQPNGQRENENVLPWGSRNVTAIGFTYYGAKKREPWLPSVV